jgi:SAM-dependent methyltransferase
VTSVLPHLDPTEVDRPFPDPAVADLLEVVRAQVAAEGRPEALGPAAYAAGHAAFERRSDQRDRIHALLLRRLVTRVAGPLALLSVGCGDGSLDVPLASALGTAGDRPLRYVGVEPYAGSASTFARSMTGLVRPRFSSQVHQAPFDEVAPDLGETFDVVMFVHSMYYVEDVETTLRTALGLLRPGGELLVLSAPRGALNRLVDVLAPPVHGHDQWFSEDVSGAVARAGLPAEPVQRLAARLGLTGAGHDVLDFTVQARLTDTLRPLVLDYLAETALTRSGLVQPHPVDVHRLLAPLPA